MSSIENVISHLLQTRYPELEGLDLLVTRSGTNQNDGNHTFSFETLNELPKSGRGEYNERTHRIVWFDLIL